MRTKFTGDRRASSKFLNRHRWTRCQPSVANAETLGTSDVQILLEMKANKYCVGLVLLLLTYGTAQTSSGSEGAAESPHAVPVLTGAFGFVPSFQPSDQTLDFKFEPILLFPIANRFLVESEYSMELPVSRQDGKFGPAVLTHGFEYFQLDYLVQPSLTIVAGYFATPFGIYKERQDPQWIRNLQDPPLIFPMNDNSSNGISARGGVTLNAKIKFNYATYYSAPSTNSQFASGRQAGERVSLFFPSIRLEIGSSYSRHLGSTQYHIVGGDYTWNLRRVPIDLRGEYVWGDKLGSGYWTEALYRSIARSTFLRHSQAVLREEQYFAPGSPQTINPSLPALSTTKVTVGWNYWVKDYLKFVASYGRAFDTTGSSPITTVGFVYRFTTGLER